METSICTWHLVRMPGGKPHVYLGTGPEADRHEGAGGDTYMHVGVVPDTGPRGPVRTRTCTWQTLGMPHRLEEGGWDPCMHVDADQDGHRSEGGGEHPYMHVKFGLASLPGRWGTVYIHFRAGPGDFFFWNHFGLSHFPEIHE